ncbi:hypothetical protein [Haladaptatus sp. NG-SE-30]
MTDVVKVAVGLVGIGIGLIGYRYAYHFSWFSEQLDAIGSKTPASDVEPAEWKVLFTRISFLLLAVLGMFFAIFGALAP